MNNLVDFFFDKGTLGVIIIVLGFVVFQLVQRYDKAIEDLKIEKDKRLTDAKEFTTIYNTTAEKYATLLEKTNNNDTLIIAGINGIASQLQNK